MHKTATREFYLFGNEKIWLKYDLKKPEQHAMFWESVKTIEDMNHPKFGKSALSIELNLNADGSIREAKITDRFRNFTAKFDGIGKLIEDEWLKKSSGYMEFAKECEKGLSSLLEHIGGTQKPSQAPFTKEVFKQHLIKTEAQKTKFKYVAGKKGRRPRTTEQIEEKRKEIEAFCEQKGIDIKNHPSLYQKSLKNLAKIVEKAEEEHMPFTPYRNFLGFAYKSFNTNLQSMREHGIDPVKFPSGLVFSSGNFSENLKTCKENNRDPIKESLLWHLNMKPEKFSEFLKDYIPPELRLPKKLGERRLSPEGREKKIIDIIVERGVEEKDIKEYVKRVSQRAVKKIIEMCDENKFDWKKYQIVFTFAPNTLGSNLQSCTSKDIDPVKFALISKLVLPNNRFNVLLESIITENTMPRKLSPEEKRSKILEIMAKEGLGENEMSEHIKKISPKSVKRIIAVCEKYKFDWKNNQSVFSYGPNALNLKLTLCDYNHVDPTVHGVVTNLGLHYEKFKEFLKTFMAQSGLESKEVEQHPFAAEMGREVIAIMVKRGIEEKNIENYVKKIHPETVEKIIDICDRNNFDWQDHQRVLTYDPKTVNANLNLCTHNNINPIMFQLTRSLGLPKEEFKDLLKTMMAQRRLAFKEPEAHQ